MSAKDVAEYMLQELTKDGILYQEKLVPKIQKLFGDEFVFANAHGTFSLDRKVLREFNKIKGENILWDRDGFCWK